MRALRDLGVNRGATGSHIIECDDGKTYVVKFASGSKAAVNEFVGQALAAAVGLPVPNASLVELDAEFVDGSDDLRYRGIVPGLHPGSERVMDSFELGEAARAMPLARLRIINAESIPGTICHDNWVLAGDRDRADNHLLQRTDEGMRYFMVDFSHAFTGPTWTVDSLEQASYTRTLVPADRLLSDAVTGMDSLRPMLERIEGVTDSEIEEIVGSVPAPWGLSRDEAACLVDFLERRRGLLRSNLESSKFAFANWVD